MNIKPIVKQADILPDIYLQDVKRYAASGMTPDRIALLLDFKPLERSLFLERISTPGDVYHKFFHAGQTERDSLIMEKLCNKAETGDVEAIETFAKAQQDINSLDLRQKLFGV